MSPLVPGQTIVGIRFRPGAAGALLGLPAKEIRDARVPVDALWRNGGELVERLAASPRSQGRRALLERALLARRADAELPDPLVAGALRLLGRPAAACVRWALRSPSASVSCCGVSRRRSGTGRRSRIASCASSASWRSLPTATRSRALPRSS